MQVLTVLDCLLGHQMPSVLMNMKVVCLKMTILLSADGNGYQQCTKEEKSHGLGVFITLYRFPTASVC